MAQICHEAECAGTLKKQAIGRHVRRYAWQDPPLASRYYARSISAEISSQSRVRFRSRQLWRPERHGARLRAGEPDILFLPAIPRVILLVFLLVSAAIDEVNYFTFKWLWQWSSIGQGHQQAFA